MLTVSCSTHRHNSSQSSSPSSSAPNSPSGNQDTSIGTLHGLAPKLSGQRTGQEGGSQPAASPLSPLARTPLNPTAHLPAAVPIPLLGHSLSAIQDGSNPFPSQNALPTHHASGRREAQECRNPSVPLLSVQSEEKLSPSYGGDKKHLCSRKHSLEVTQEEVPREQQRSGK